LAFVDCTRHPIRNRVIVLLSAKAGLRAGEIASLTWDMVLDAGGKVGYIIELRDHAAKEGQRPADSDSPRACRRPFRLAPDLRGAANEVPALVGPVPNWPVRQKAPYTMEKLCMIRSRLLRCSLQGNSAHDWRLNWIGGFGCRLHIRRGDGLMPVMLDNDTPCSPERGLLDVHAD
jgi:integrase